MIVLDASAGVELLLASQAGRKLALELEPPELTLHAPELFDLEVTHVLRRSLLLGNLSETRARQALDHLQLLDVERYSHHPLLPRIWALRANLTTYDAAYVALAEALEAPLWTCDQRLAGSPGHSAEIRFVG